MLNFKIYLSDEEYGYIVRQRAILEKLYDFSNDPIDFTLQSYNHLKEAKEILEKEILFFDEATTALYD